MTGTGSQRAALIARTATALIADRGLRGLTHRAVDGAAGLPPGSTSYHARTRARLVEIALRHIADAETGDIDPALLTRPPTDLDSVARLVADFLHATIARDPERAVARIELALEARRRPELRAVYDRIGAGFRSQAEATLAELGSPTPRRHARTLVAWCDGVVFDSLAGAGAATPPSHDALRADAAELLRALVGGHPPG